MKRGGYIQRYTPLQAKKWGIGTSKPKVANKVAKRSKLPKPSTVRTKCDNLLTPIIKEKYPNCLLKGAQNCAGLTQVAHHHVNKSMSSHLRYNLENLIPLCGACHVMLHNDEGYWGAMVAKIKGPKWFSYIEGEKHKQVKTDVHFYIENLARLRALQAVIANQNGLSHHSDTERKEERILNPE